MPPPKPIVLTVGRKFHVGPKIGSGSFGEIYAGENIHSKEVSFCLNVCLGPIILVRVHVKRVNVFTAILTTTLLMRRLAKRNTRLYHFLCAVSLSLYLRTHTNTSIHTHDAHTHTTHRRWQ